MDGERKKQFEILIKECLKVMYRVALRLTKNDKDAEDLVSEAIVLAWKNFAHLKDKQKFKPWILKILTNTYISSYRHKRSHPDPIRLESNSADEENENFSLFEALASPFLLWQTNPEKMFINSLLKEDIIKALESLPDQYRIVVTLCELESQSYQEAAEILNLPIGTVRSRLFRGRSILQKRLWNWAKEKGY
jgi:RNA polymerase sigma-70 factor, ECF subfamily